MADSRLVQLGKTDRNPVEQTEYNSLGGDSAYKSALGSTGSMSGDPQSIIQSSIKAMQDANKPVVDSLQATIPEVSAKFAQTKEQLTNSQPNLEAQYNTLIDSIKTEKTGAVNNQTKITNNEFGKRGLVGSSTAVQQGITDAVQPVSERYTNLETSTGVQKAQAIKALTDQIANLGPQEVEAKRAIQDAIAKIQAGANTSGASQGLDLYKINLAQQNADREFQANKEQQDIANALAQLKATSGGGYQTIGEGASLYDPTTGKIIATAPKTYKDLAGGAGNPLGI